MAQIHHILLRREIAIVQIQAESVVVVQQTHYRGEIGNVPPALCEGFNLRLDSTDHRVIIAEEHVAFVPLLQSGLKLPLGVAVSSKQKRARNPPRPVALT